VVIDNPKTNSLRAFLVFPCDSEALLQNNSLSVFPCNISFSFYFAIYINQFLFIHFYAILQTKSFNYQWRFD